METAEGTGYILSWRSTSKISARPLNSPIFLFYFLTEWCVLHIGLISLRFITRTITSKSKSNTRENRNLFRLYFWTYISIAFSPKIIVIRNVIFVWIVLSKNVQFSIALLFSILQNYAIKSSRIYVVIEIKLALTNSMSHPEISLYFGMFSILSTCDNETSHSKIHA